MNLLEVKNLRGGYSGADILKDLNFFVGEEEIVLLIGPNGAGKSTAMKALFGLVKIHQGEILFQGNPTTGFPPEKMVPSGISYVPQEKNVFRHMSVRENLELGAYIQPSAIKAGIERAFDSFPPLKEKANALAGELSGGQRQMVAIARALMLSPKLILLDEPTAGLSPLYMSEIFARIKDIHAAGTAILMVEQNAKQALAIADRAYILVNGKEKYEATGAEMLAREDIGQLFLGGQIS